MCHSRYFRIAGLVLKLVPPCETTVEEAFRPFEIQPEKPEIRVHFTCCPELQKPDGTEVCREPGITICSGASGNCRVFYSNTMQTDIQALSRYEWKTGVAEIQYPEGRQNAFSRVGCIFGHIGFEEVMASRNRLILHASLIDTPAGGILFSGVSGIGKSTQAELWHKWEGAEILNGDRPILYLSEEGWQAWGSPYAGSSRYHINQKTSVAAVILLRQDKICRLRRLSPSEAFRRLYPAVTVNSWNQEYVNRACDLLSGLVQSKPVYEYSCTADETAVKVLKKELFQEDD